MCGNFILALLLRRRLISLQHVCCASSSSSTKDASMFDFFSKEFRSKNVDGKEGELENDRQLVGRGNFVSVKRMSDSPKGGQLKLLFERHWTQNRLLDYLQRGIVRKGRFHVSQENYREGYVLLDRGRKWFIPNVKSMNRALHGDLVVAKLLPMSEWRKPECMIRLRDMEEAESSADVYENCLPMDEQAVLTGPDDEMMQSNSVPTAKIVGILDRNWRSYTGIVLPPSGKGSHCFLFSPTNRLIPRIRVEPFRYRELRGKKLFVQVNKWLATSRYPDGNIMRVIGENGHRVTEERAILLDNEILHAEFSPAVLNCLPDRSWRPDFDEKNREDLTHLDVFSIDPEGCTDIDDALHCTVLGNGCFEVGVHIADVSHFVRPQTPVDLEASRRSTTVYMSDGYRIDMLPELLSADLCSLRERESRYTFSVMWHLDVEAKVRSVRFTKSLICSRAALTYQRAQQIIDGEEIHELAQSLRNLMKLSACLRSRRKKEGALELASAEIHFDVDRETGIPLKVFEKQHLPTMSLIEEFMLLANIAVAERTLEAFPDCAILRRHPIPSRESFKMLTEVASAIGFQLNVDTGKDLAISLDEVDRLCQEASPDEDDARGMTAHMLRMLTTRCMTQAVYFAAATVPRTQRFHYGLAAKVYTHFTSPIRRYADIMVHRLLATAIGVDTMHPSMADRRRLVRQTENMNKRHRQAQYASRASVLLNTFLMIKEHPEPSIAAIVMGIRNNGIQVMVPKYGLESVIFFTGGIDASTDGNKKKGLSVEDIHRLCTKRITLFQKVTVSMTLEERNQRRLIRIRLLDPYVEGLSDGASVVTGYDPEI